MLTRLKLQNFKSFADAEVELGPLTFLVGANASGKSNLIDALRVLKGHAIGLDIAQVFEGRRVGETVTWPGIRGGLAEAARTGHSDFDIESVWNVGDPVFNATGEPTRAGTRHVVHRLRGIIKPRATFEEQTDDQDGWLEPALQELELLDPRPDRMRGFGNPAGPLGVEGENLSGLLASAASERKDVVVAWLRELCAPEIEDIDFIRIPELQQVMLTLVERGGARISARSVSDGTLRFLYLIAAHRRRHRHRCRY